MSYALIDNATLTAVQRITGQVASRSHDSVDVDLVAYENYIQARLFYDDVVALDDYIPRFRSERQAAFPKVSFIDPNNLKLQEISAEADKISEHIRPRIQGGQFANTEFKALFDLLQSHMICTWDISSSVYHLTLKVLAAPGSSEFDKYGALATAIFQELSDASTEGRRIPGKVELLDRFGNPITNDYSVPDAQWGNGKSGPPSSAISAFTASLIWLSNRAIYYTLASSFLKADSFLYPIRQAYQQHYLSKTLNYGADFPKRIVTQISSTLSKDVVAIHTGGAIAATALDIPVFSAWLINQCGDTNASLYALEEIRNRNEFIEARGQLNELRITAEDGDIKNANKKILKFQKNLSKVSTNMREKYSIKTNQGVPVTRLVSVYNAYAALQGLPQVPKLDISIKIPQVLRDMKREYGFFAAYRNVINDLGTFGSLGKIRELLGKSVVLDPKLAAYSPKAEDPRYRHAHSFFKSPM